MSFGSIFTSSLSHPFTNSGRTSLAELSRKRCFPLRFGYRTCDVHMRLDLPGPST